MRSYIKIFSLLIALSVTLCACGCGSNSSKPETVGAASVSDVVSAADKPAAPERYDLENVTPGTGGSYTCTYAGEKHTFNVCLPLETSENMPLIIMLHGYGSTPDGFKLQTKMDIAAAKRGYAVVFAGSAAAGWDSGLGEYQRDDVGYLAALAEYIQNEYKCSPELTFAAGFSNGAFMSHRLASDAPETFRAVACVAGMMPKKVWDSRKDSTDVGVLEIYGTKDDVIPSKLCGTDATAIDPPIEDVMSYWAAANSLSESTTETLSDRSELTRYDGDSSVWTIVIQDGRHSWPEKSFAGFDTNKMILDFFDTFRS